MKIEGFEDFISLLEEADEIIDKEVKETVVRIGNKLLRKVKLKTPVDTGVLRNNWHSKKGENDYTRYIFNNTSYAPHVEFGHRVVGGKGGSKEKRRKGNKREAGPRKTSGKGYVEGVYMLTKSVKEVEQDLDKDFEKMMKKIWK